MKKVPFVSTIALCSALLVPTAFAAGTTTAPAPITVSSKALSSTINVGPISTSSLNIKQGQAINPQLIVAAPTVQWNKQLSSSGVVNSVRANAAGGYILAAPNDAGGFSIVQTDTGGNKIWEQDLGAQVGKSGLAYDAEPTSDGGYIVAGKLGTSAALIKTDQNGSIQWGQLYNGLGASAGAYSVRQTPDGGYIFAGDTQGPASGGTTPYAIYVVKTDAAGNAQWANGYAPSSTKYIYSGGYASCLQLTSDGGYVVVGSRWATNSNNAAADIFKLNASGGVQWIQEYGASNVSVIAQSIKQTSDGGYIVALDYKYSAGLLKVNALGGQQWFKTTYSGSKQSTAKDVIQNADGSYTAAGGILSTTGKWDGFWFNVDTNGNVQWSQQVTGGTSTDSFYSLTRTGDGTHVLGGRSNVGGSGQWLVSAK